MNGIAGPVLFAAGMTLLLATASGADSAAVTRGRYIFAVAGGCGCHTPEDGPVNAGGRPTVTPFGTFYGTNITQDRTHGIGDWSDREIVDSIRLGVRPTGERMSPVMPYPAFRGMSDADASDLVAYLRSVPPVARPNRRPETKLPFPGLAASAWRWLFFDERAAPRTSSGATIDRGHYLTEHVSHCVECHTPRNALGVLDRSRYLAGTPDGPDGEVMPNITPDPETGIGEWSEREIADFVRTGFYPNGDNAQGLMALLIDGLELGYDDMTKDDALAIAAYLKTVPPIVHRIETAEEEEEE